MEIGQKPYYELGCDSAIKLFNEVNRPKKQIACMRFQTGSGAADPECEVVTSEDSCMPQPGEKPYYDMPCDTAHSLFDQSSRETYVFQGKVDITKRLNIAGEKASLNNVGVLRIGRLQDTDKTSGAEEEEHTIGGLGMKNEGGLEINAKVRITNFTNAGGKVRLSGVGARVRSTRFEQQGKDAEIAVFDGAVVESVTGLRTDPMWFKGGKVCGDNGTYRGRLILSNNSTLQPGDPSVDAYGEEGTDSRSGHAKLTVDGNLDMDDTSTTAITVDTMSDSSDLVEITGSCELNGRLSMRLKMSKRSNEDVTVTLLVVRGKLSGKFSGCDGCGPEDKINYLSGDAALSRGRKLQDASTVTLTIKGIETKSPTKAPTKVSTKAPTKRVTKAPGRVVTTNTPTKVPTVATSPIEAATTSPTSQPTKHPTSADSVPSNEKPQSPSTDQNLSTQEKQDERTSYPKQKNKEGGSSSTVAIGAGAGGAVVVLLAVAAYFMCRSKKNVPSAVPHPVQSLDLEKKLDGTMYKLGNELKV